ncbi:MAG: type II 3-dehydroquinate dehydratase [Bdellovibrionales bacterium]|nr:type II 3-dehydroquinate dehydratase [Bdellovibrionales bacterium]
MNLALINGPNLNLLGTREPEIYGSLTLPQLVARVTEHAATLGFGIESFQSNVEGELVTYIQQARGSSQGIIINPAGYSHTSVAIRDAISAVGLPTIEVHLSNIFAREEFRHHSHVSAVAKGVICGCGVKGYLLAVDALAELLK